MADDRKREPLAYRPTKRAVVRELVSLACLACVLATASIYWHYRLPTPLAPTTPLLPASRTLVTAAVIIRIAERVYRRSIMQTGRKLTYREALSLKE